MSDAKRESGFGNDPQVRAEVRRLIDAWGIRTIVETGTYLGYTARALATMGPRVHTIEASVGYFDQAVRVLGGSGVTMHLGSSPEVLRRIAPTLERPVLFYLDAHWNGTPILDELQAIGQQCPDSVLVVHDVKNPEHPEFGFDTYGGIVLDWKYLRQAVGSAYTNGFTQYHNERAGGKLVGVLYVVPHGGHNFKIPVR